MGDLLIRNVPESVRSELRNIALRRGAHLSDIAREALQIGTLAVAKRQAATDGMLAGDRLRALFSGLASTAESEDDFRDALASVRQGGHRPLPFAE